MKKIHYIFSAILIFLTSSFSIQAEEKVEYHRMTPERVHSVLSGKMDTFLRQHQNPLYTPQFFIQFLNDAGLEINPAKQIVNVTWEELQKRCKTQAEVNIGYHAAMQEITDKADIKFQTVQTGKIVSFETIRNQQVKGFFYEATDTDILVNDTRYKWKTIKRQHWHLFSKEYAAQDKKTFITEEQKKLDATLTKETNRIFHINWQKLILNNVYSCGVFYDFDKKQWVDIIPQLEQTFEKKINDINRKKQDKMIARQKAEEQKRIAEEKRRIAEEKKRQEEKRKQQEQERRERLLEQQRAEARKLAEEQRLKAKALLDQELKTFFESMEKLQKQGALLTADDQKVRQDETALREKYNNESADAKDRRSMFLRDHLLISNRKLAIRQTQVELLQTKDHLWQNKAQIIETHKKSLTPDELKTFTDTINTERHKIAATIRDLKLQMNDLRNYMSDIRAELNRLDKAAAK